MKPLAPNSLIQNRYLIVHLVGKGGMGEVYLAVDQRLGSAIALKRTFFADDEMLGGAFEREARTLARLRHPVLPKVSDHFTENGEQYLVMEHIAGDDLSKRLEAAQKPFPLTWVLFWSDQLLDALAYLHSHEPPIIHRDIKPQNLKLTDENHIVLLDFGLSKNSTGQTKATSGSSGSVVGYTPHYAPMEQIRGTGTNPRSDIYSLSATLYQLMTNTIPDDALTRADTLLNGKPDPIVPLHELNPEVPKEVSEVILRGMEVSQEKRYSTAKEMQKALRKAFSQMQEAMSAQTIAFTAPGTGDGSSKIEQPIGVAHSADDQRFDEADSQATQVRPDREDRDAPMRAAEPVVNYNGPSDIGVRQSDVKTEVYHAGSAPVYTPTDPEPGIDKASSAPASTDEWDVPAVPAREAYAVDATQANVDFSPPIPAAPSAIEETFASSSSVPSDPFATRTAQPEMRQDPISEIPRPVPVAAKPKKKSKTPLVVGALAGLFILGIIAVGAGWFAYTNYFANAVAEATPTPAPAVEFTPTPEPTLEAITDTNTNTSIAESNSNSSLNTNSNTDIPALEPAPIPELQTRETTPGSRPQQSETRRTASNPRSSPANSGNPGTKSTPKKTNRTVILQ